MRLWTEDDSRDLDRAIKALRLAERRERSPLPPRDKPPPPTRRLPVPKRLPNGRWVAHVEHKGKGYGKTFDTYAEAEQFIRQIKEQ